MTIKQIHDALNKLHIPFTVQQPDGFSTDTDYQPASIKAPVIGGLYFIDNANDYSHLKIVASVILCAEFFKSENYLIKVDTPQLVHYQITQDYHQSESTGIHPTAQIHANAKLGKNVSIGAFCVIDDCTIGDNVNIRHHVVIEAGVTIGNHCSIDSHTVIGAKGLAWVWDNNGDRIFQPQIGTVIIEDHCYLASHITVVRGSLSESTRIGKGTAIAHGTAIGHGAQIGANVHMANNVSLAGNAVVGDYSFLGSGAILSSQVRIANNTIVGSGAVVHKSFTEEYITLAGVPAKIIKHKNYEAKPKGVPKPYKK